MRKLNPVEMKDWEIAEAAEETLRPAADLAAELGLKDGEWSAYGPSLAKIDATGGISPSVRDAFAEKSRKYVPFTNILTFNLRTIVLFILLFLPGHLEVIFFPFTIFAIEIARIVIILKYEKLSKKVAETASFELEAAPAALEEVATDVATEAPAEDKTEQEN